MSRDSIAIALPPIPPRGRGASLMRLRRLSAVAQVVVALLVVVSLGATAEEVVEAEADAPKSSSRFGPPPPPMGARFVETLEGDRIRLGYSFERIRMAGLRSGDDHWTPDQARAFGFSETPRSLESTLHTLSVAYAAHPRVTLVLEVPFVQNEYERFDLVSGRRQHQAEGVGDVGFAVVVPFIRKGFESSQVHIGLDVPTGSIRRSAEGRPLPYAAQPGNGSVDLEWGWTYKGELDRVSWGGQVTGRHPVGRSGRDWREGSRFSGRLWGVVRVLGGLSASLRAEWEKMNEIDGFDRNLQPPVDPSEDPELQDGVLLALAPGLSMEMPALAGQRFGVEIGIPVYQDLDGPQLERDWTFRAGWQWVY
ncbi:MAG: hypothetical protein CL931_03140 [Deltaproteobacteria bacterium]|nr:hypothetical protein [Deltaproteobacteria bacterium]